MPERAFLTMPDGTEHEYTPDPRCIVIPSTIPWSELTRIVGGEVSSMGSGQLYCEQVRPNVWEYSGEVRVMGPFWLQDGVNRSSGPELVLGWRCLTWRSE